MGDVISMVERRRKPLGDTEADAFYRDGCRCDDDSGDLARAEECYRQSLQKNHQHAGALVNLGNILFKRGLTGEAERHYRAAMVANPANAEAFYNVGFLLIQDGSPARAALYFQRAIHIDPALADAYYNCGVAMDSAMEHQMAKWYFAEYARISPVGDWADEARRRAGL